MDVTRAQRKHLRRSLALLVVLVPTSLGALRYAQNHHLQETALYLCVALPWSVMCGVIASIALYLRQERDGYMRDLSIRSILWSTGAVMAVNLFVMYLRMFGWKGQTPVSLELYVFSGVSLVTAIAYGIANNPGFEERKSKCGPKEMER